MEKQNNKSTFLIMLCWLVYTCSYLGKLGYNANITKIEESYSVSHSVAGMVSTFFFFAYGVGQVINGVFCKKYNLRIVVFSSLIISGLMNLLVVFINDFTILRYFWLVNGASLSLLWPSLIRLLSETLDKKQIGKAVIVMGTTVATGTFLVYGLSALFVALDTYKSIFILAGTLLPVIAIIWMIFYSKLVVNNNTQSQATVTTEIEQSQSKKVNLALVIPIFILGFFAIIDNLVKDGLTTWVPMILKETYELPDYASILLTMVLPILAIFGTAVAVRMHKKIKDFVFLIGVLFLIAGSFIGAVILCLPTGLFVITLASFGIVACLMSGVNNVITSMAPLYWKERFNNSGLLAGVLNGCCYVGSTLSAYGLGLIAENNGWKFVFILLTALCFLSVLISLCYTVITKIKGKNVKEIHEN